MNGSQPVARHPGLSLPRALAFALVNLPISAAAIAIAVYLPRHYASHLGLELSVVGAAFFLVRLIDIPIDVVLGWAMDRTRTPFGRFRPWMAGGAPILLIGIWLLFFAEPGVDRGYLVTALLVTYLGISILTLSSVAWGASLAARYHDRSRLFGLMVGLGVLGSAAVICIPVLQEAHQVRDASNVPTMGRLILVLAPLAVAVAVLRTPERVSPPGAAEGARLRDFAALALRPDFGRILLADLCLGLGPGWMSASYLFFFTDSRGFTPGQASILLAIYILAGIVGAPLMGRLATLISKHRALMVACTGYALILVTLLAIPRGNMPVGGLVLFLAGLLASGFRVLTQAMTADIADEVRLEAGGERAGLLYAGTTMTQKVAGALSIGLTFWVLAQVGYDAAQGAANSAHAVRNLELVFLAGPVVFVMLGGLCMIGYRLDAERHAEVRRRLDERDGAGDVGLAAEPAGGVAPVEAPPAH